MAFSWTAYSAGTNAIRIQVTNTGGYSYFKYVLRNASGDTVLSGPTDYMTQSYYIFSGLQAGTTYTLGISWSHSTTGEGNYDTKQATTDEESTIPNWSWTDSNGTASASETYAAYLAVSNQGRTSDFSYRVWNDLVDLTQTAITEGLGSSWQTSSPSGKTYLSYSSTRMSASNKVLTAARFNSLRYNIGYRVSTGITDRETGQPVLGSYFLTLANKLNEMIDNI